ncbi:beta-1,3-galactosyltransferase 5-like [Mercenaria mercenaria]|uniref:beta-1,3-galactosyltransferase 5-like n=1 Tax=Mercenaria mercenaria TaxID=6596 RepID=UPI00234EA4BD|nr:beta-1,3-galactosyltransferase 5-like [Mercenaria mercenaria]
MESDEFAFITLKPETAAQLNAKSSSNINFALTIGRPYWLENPNLCSKVENLTVIVIVHSAIQHFGHRTVIRETWTNNSYYPHLGNIKILFLLGKDNDLKHQLLIDNEFKRHGDILQGDFIDAYKNMTHKNVMGFKWLSERCRNAKIVLKIDDDVVINMFYFLSQFARSFLMKTKHMSCVRLSKITVKRGGKWAVDRSLFQGNYYYYPDYCQGFMVAISIDVIPALYKSASITPFFWIDDVFAYGMVPANVPEMQYTNINIGRDVAWYEHHALSCYKNISRTEKCSYFVVLVRGKVTQKLRSFWKLMVEEHNSFK